MKLIYYIIIRISLVLSVLLTGWAILFYFAVMDEVNDEVDDSLEDYSEIIIIRALAGEERPSKKTASNNQYFLREVTKEYAGSCDDIIYKDSMVYIPEKDETEPARILTTIFKDDGEKFFELTVATPSIEKEDLKDAMAGWIIFLYIALLLTIIVINVWVFYRNMRPLYVLLHWLDKYRIGKVNEPLQNNTRVSEFRKLNEAAVRYAERSEQMFEQQKQFIGNASHEMQTPLAICRNRLEMLMEDENLSESQLEELLSMLAIATVCDVVDLTGENRIFVKEGLRRIKDTQNIGIDIIGYGNYHLAHYDRENDSTNVLEIMFPTGITQSKYCRTVC